MTWSRLTVVAIVISPFVFWITAITAFWEIYQFEMSLAMFSGIFNTIYFFIVSIYFMVWFLILWEESLTKEEHTDVKVMASLPPEAREAVDQFIKTKLIPRLGLYVKPPVSIEDIIRKYLLPDEIEMMKRKATRKDGEEEKEKRSRRMTEKEVEEYTDAYMTYKIAKLGRRFEMLCHEMKHGEEEKEKRSRRMIGQIEMIIPMERIRASQTPEALARDEKRKQEFMKRVCQAALKESFENWKKRLPVKEK